MSARNVPDDIVKRCSAAILAQLRAGASIAGVAAALALTPRTLQRRLRRQGTTYAALLSAVRVEIAGQALANGTRVTALAPVLGFSESSTVSRFLHLAGITPPAPRAPVQAHAPAAAQSGGFAPLLATIYESEAPNRWQDAVHGAMTLLGATFVRAYVRHEAGAPTVFDAVAPDGIAGEVARYDSEYWNRDPRMLAISAWSGRPAACTDLVDPAVFDKSALVNDLLDSPYVDTRWSMVEYAPLSDGRELMLVVGRPRRQGPYLAEDKARLHRLYQHVRRAFDFELVSGTLGRASVALEDALDLASDGVLVVSPQLDLLHANAQGSALLGAGLGLRLVHGKLVAESGATQTALEHAVAAATGEEASGAELRVPLRAADGTRFTATAVRLPRVHFVHASARDRQCALVLKLETAEIEAGLGAIARALGLNPAEGEALRELVRIGRRGGGGDDEKGREARAVLRAGLRAEIARLLKRDPG